jgi:hypothetical protein
MKELSYLLIALAIILGTPSAMGAVAVANSVTTGAGSIAYGIIYSDTAGTLTQNPTVDVVSNNEFISVAVKGCSIKNADSINGGLVARSAGGDYAEVETNIKGPGASVTNFNLYGYVTPNLAWAGQYADSMKGSSLDIFARGMNHNTPCAFWDASSLDSAWARSGIFTSDASAPVYTVKGLWQDAMAGGSQNPTAYPRGVWAMSDLYSGAVTVDSTYPGDWAKMRTASGYMADSSVGGSTEFFTNSNLKGFVAVAGPSMAYADSRLGYSDLDAAYKDYRGFAYAYTDSDKGISDSDVIYW